MSELEIDWIDPADEALLRAWWEVGRDASAERPLEAWPVWEVSRRALPRARDDVRIELLLARLDGRAVGGGLLACFLQDNTHLAEITIHVRPEERRRGIGRALLARAERRAAAAGRTTVVSTAFAPLDAESAGLLFAAANGYPVASAEETKVVDLAENLPRWAGLDAEVSTALGNYRVEVFEDHVPDAWVDDLCSMLSAFMGLIPSGDLDLEEACWTPERLAAHEERTAEQGRTWVVAVGVAPDGRLCGFTELGISRADAGHASVGGTLVVPGHRGHRLGLAMKLASHRRLHELYPDCATVRTGNAGVNAHMNAVNERLGYRVVERALDVQKRLAPAASTQRADAPATAAG